MSRVYKKNGLNTSKLSINILAVLSVINVVVFAALIATDLNSSPWSDFELLRVEIVFHSSIFALSTFFCYFAGRLSMKGNLQDAHSQLTADTDSAEAMLRQLERL